MATGRMIVNAICADKRINQLSDDTSRLAFTWLITFADREGRTYGDPGVVRSMLFPRRQDVSIEQMAAYLAEWHALGLVVWYEADGDKWLYFPTFEKNQPGMRKEKEAPSRIPPPPVAGTPEVRTEDGVSTPEVPLKGMELKRKEEKSATPLSSFDEVRTAIEDITGLPPNGSATAAINEILTLSPLRADIEAAYSWLVDQGKQFRYYGSLVGPTRTAVSLRLAKPPQKKPPTAAELGWLPA